MSPLLAQSRHPQLRRTRLLSGVKRTCLVALQISASDPMRTLRQSSPFQNGSLCHLLNRGAINEAARVHHAFEWGGGMADRRICPAAQEKADWRANEPRRGRSANQGACRSVPAGSRKTRMVG